MAKVIRTKEEQDAMILKLLALKETVPPTSTFGDDNHRGIDAQIETIRSNNTEANIMSEYESEEDTYVMDMALDARRWLEGGLQDNDLLEQF
jgi:hypothetical protein